MNNTSSHHAIIDIETGETICVEKCRNTMGGWANMARRVEARFGGFMRPEDADADDIIWNCNGVRFRTMEVQTF